MIQLPPERISKHHAVIHKQNEAWSIEDLGSRNGVLVNGQRIGNYNLKDRDLIRIGPYEFYFELNVPSHDFVPRYILDLSSKTHEQTMIDEEPPKSS